MWMRFWNTKWAIVAGGVASHVRGLQCQALEERNERESVRKEGGGEGRREGKKGGKQEGRRRKKRGRKEG